MQAIFKERFFPHRRDEGVRKGLMLSSLPEAKNSSSVQSFFPVATSQFRSMTIVLPTLVTRGGLRCASTLKSIAICLLTGITS